MLAGARLRAASPPEPLQMAFRWRDRHGELVSPASRPRDRPAAQAPRGQIFISPERGGKQQAPRVSPGVPSAGAESAEPAAPRSRVLGGAESSKY